MFETIHWSLQEPGKALIRVYNLKPETEKRVNPKEFTKVTLSAGYADPGAPYGVIFSGNIIDAWSKRANPVDTYLEILASDGDQAYNYAVVSKTLAPGSTFKDQLRAIEEALKPHGVTLGYIPDRRADVRDCARLSSDRADSIRRRRNRDFSRWRDDNRFWKIPLLIVPVGRVAVRYGRSSLPDQNQINA